MPSPDVEIGTEIRDADPVLIEMRWALAGLVRKAGGSTEFAFEFLQDELDDGPMALAAAARPFLDDSLRGEELLSLGGPSRSAV